MTTHEKARTAAIKAANEIAIDGAPVPEYVDAIITAYLSALLPEDAAGLVERLSNSAYGLPAKAPAAINYCAAASLNQSQAARIAELEEAAGGLLQCHDGVPMMGFEATRRAERVRSLLNKDRRP